eukprot:4394821-Amphidinium_carterae.1
MAYVDHDVLCCPVAFFVIVFTLVVLGLVVKKTQGFPTQSFCRSDKTHSQYAAGQKQTKTQT